MGILKRTLPERKCLRCENNMEEAVLEGNEQSKMRIISQGVLFAKKSDIAPMVCPNCGYLEFVVVEPSIFKKK